jgi:hypothetical protein
MERLLNEGPPPPCIQDKESLLDEGVEGITAMVRLLAAKDVTDTADGDLRKAAFALETHRNAETILLLRPRDRAVLLVLGDRS